MRILWLSILVLTLIILTFLSRDFGITYDETVQHHYGSLVYNYFASGFKDTSSLSFGNLFLYGGMYDLVCNALAKAFSIDHPWALRHVVNSFCGWIFLLFASLIAKRFFGLSTAITAILLLLLSPRFFGHMMNNSKDIPFAAFFTAALFFMSQLDSKAPYLSRKQMLGLVISIALCINIRVGGLLLFCYLGLALGLNWIITDRLKIVQSAKSIAIFFAKVTGLAYILGIIFWPWALHSPFTRPFKALHVAQNFQQWDGLILTGGKQLSSTNLPWTYAPHWFFATCPPLLLFGFVVGQVFLVQQRKYRAFSFLNFTLIFPVAYVIAKNSVMYDGWRHLLFVYGPFISISALGIVEFLKKIKPMKLSTKAPLATFLLLLIAEPAYFHFKHHPNQVVYFSPLVGGTSQAAGKYELDYWGNCTKQSVDWLEEKAKACNQGVLVTGTVFAHIVEKYSQATPWLGYKADASQAHFQVIGVRDDPYLSTRLLSDPDVIHRVQVGDTVLCAIKRLRPAQALSCDAWQNQ